MAKNTKTSKAKRLSPLDIIKAKKLKIFIASLVVTGLIGMIGYTMFGGYVDETISSTLNSDLLDIDDNSMDANDSDYDDDLIIEPESLAAYEITTTEEDVEVQ